MEESHFSRLSDGSKYGFTDELLLALERSGKTLIEIQNTILPWGNEKTEKEITVRGEQYANDIKTTTNRMHKRIRVREILEATHDEREQVHDSYQRGLKEQKRLRQEMKDSEARFKYLADLVKNRFDVKVSSLSKKRKGSSESSGPGDLTGAGSIENEYLWQNSDAKGHSIDDEELIFAVKKDPVKREVIENLRTSDEIPAKLSRHSIIEINPLLNMDISIKQEIETKTPPSLEAFSSLLGRALSGGPTEVPASISDVETGPILSEVETLDAFSNINETVSHQMAPVSAQEGYELLDLGINTSMSGMSDAEFRTLEILTQITESAIVKQEVEDSCLTVVEDDDSSSSSSEPETPVRTSPLSPIASSISSVSAKSVSERRDRTSLPCEIKIE